MSLNSLGLLLLLLAIVVGWAGQWIAWRAKGERERRGEPAYPLARNPLAVAVIGASLVLLVSSGVFIFGF